MNEIITTTGVTITLDESAGLQNLTATPAPGGDANDNDIANSALPSVFSARLTALGLGSPTIGTALSGYTGAAGNTGSNIISVTPEPGGTITDLGFVGPGGAPLNGLDSDLNTLTGTNILLYTDTNNNIVLGRAGAADGPIVFALYLEETGTPVSGAKIWSVQYAPLENIDPTNPDDSLNLLDKVFVAASQDLEFSLANAPSGQNLFLMFTTANPTTVDDNGVTRITDPAIIATGKDPANQSTGANITTGDTVNSSQGGGTTTFGTNSQMIVEGDGIHFSFVTGARQNVTIPNLDQNEADVEANIDFTDVFDARAATFDVVQLQSGKSAVVKVSALSTDSEPGVDFIDGYGDDNSVPITHVKVALQNGTVLIDTSTGGTANGVTVAFNTGVATISGIKAGYNIEYTTTADHNRVLVENAGSGRGNASADFDIGGFQLLQVSATTVEVGSKVNFEDDGPSINTTGTEPTLTVDETVLATNDTKNFAANFTSAFGTDGAGTLTFALGISASGVDSELVDTATNNPVFLFLESGVVVGREGTDAANAVGGDVVFTVGVVPSGVDAGDVTLDQQRAVVHPDATNPDDAKSLLVDTLVTLTGTIIDEDGDSQSATLNIGQNLVFEDDGPTVTANSLVKLDDDALAGNPGGTGDDIDAENVSGTLAHSFGADGAGSIAYLTTGAPAGFSYVADGDNLLVQQGGVTVLTLTLNTATGAYLVTQNAPIVHAAGLDENNQAFTINYRVTDGDGDTADGTLALDVDDDTPTVAANSLVKLDDDALAGNPGGTGDDIDAENVSGTLAHSFGADGAGSIAYLTTGAPAGFSYVADGDNLLVKQGTTTVLTMTLNTATGAYLVTQNAPIAHAAGLDENNQEFTINYRVTDGDGDTADGTLALDVDDDTPTVAANSLVKLDDDALAGNPGGTGDDIDAENVSGTLAHSFGADGAGSIAYLTTGAPAGFSYVADGDNLLVKQGTTTVLTLTLNTATGAYLVTQNASIVHAAGLDENNQEFTINYRVTDGDGDTADGTLALDVDDDTPTVAANSLVKLDDDALAGNPGGTGDDIDAENVSGTLAHSFGADGAGSIAYLTTGAPAGFSYVADGDNLLVQQGGVTVLTLTLNTATGAYLVTQNAPIAHAAGLDENNQAFTINYRVTDGDGDTADGTLALDVDDDTPTVAANSLVKLDDDALAGNPGGTGDDIDAENVSGTLAHSFGADGAGSIAYLTTGAPAGFSYVADGDNLLVKQGTTTVLTMTLNTATGAYLVTQNAPIAHAAGLDENNQAFTINYRVADGDGDTADGTLAIDVDDDTPTLDFGNLVGTGTIAPQYGEWNGSVGADQPGNLDISLSQFQLVRPDGSTIAGSSFTFNELAGSPNPAGDFLFAGSLTADFDNNAGTADTTVDFTLTALQNGRYVFDLIQGFGSTITFSSANGSLDAGGPDAVRTLTIPPDEQVVFFGLQATTSDSDIVSAIGLGEPDLTEAQIEAGGFSFLGSANMNVSTSGIGIGNNNLDGNGTAGINAGDESFVINPETLLTGVKVFIDNSVGGYDPATEELYYKIFFDDGTNSGSIKVLSGDLTSEAGGQKSFAIDTQGAKLIDSVQLTMGKGVIKVPVIEFIKSTENLASDVKLDFSASLTDADSDTATSNFSVDLFANDLGQTFDFTLVGASSDLDGFDVDLSASQVSYKIEGFDKPADKLFLLGDSGAGVSIDNSGANSIVSVTETTGGQTTVITVVGVDLASSDIVLI